MTCGVYEILNTVNGKRYVGSSDNIERRWRRHRNDLGGNRHHSRHLQRAWNADGADAFLFRVVLICSENNLLDYEQRVLSLYRAGDCRFGYNESEIAGSRRGVKHSPETRAKMSQAAKNRPPLSEETKRRLSEAAKEAVKEGKLFSEEHRKKISAALVGRHVSEETRRKISANNAARASVLIKTEDGLMTVKQYAEKFGMTENGVRARVRRGYVEVERM